MTGKGDRDDRSDSSPRRGIGALVFAVSLLLVALAVEWTSRRFLPDGYFVWPPGFQRTFDAGDVIRHGVSFPARLTINEWGMRGGLPDERTALRILAVGGSTTLCVYLDDAFAWPLLLEERLDAALGEGRAWVGNVGRPGHKTDHHVLQVERLLAQYPETDALVLLVGVNDFLTDLSAASDPAAALEPSPAQLRAMAFSLFPGWDADTPWYRRNLIGRALWRLDWRPLPGTQELQPMDAKGRFQAALRSYRRHAGRFVDALPDLDARLARYREKLGRIADTARARGVQVVFVTQPTLWRSDLSPQAQSLLWAGGPPFWALRDGAEYYTVEALAAGMARYNRALLEVCVARRGLCIDAASRIERSTDVFFDDAHFTEEGSARLADVIAAPLLSAVRSGGPLDPSRPHPPGPARPVGGR